MYRAPGEWGTMPPMMSSRLLSAGHTRTVGRQATTRTCFSAAVDSGEDGQRGDEHGDVCQGHDQRGRHGADGYAGYATSRV